MDNRDYKRIISISRVICIVLFACLVIMCLYIYIYFFRDYLLNKKVKNNLEIKTEELNEYEDDVEEYLSDSDYGDYKEVSYANRFDYFMRNFNYDFISPNDYLKENYSNPRIINNADDSEEIIKLFRDYGMNWNPDYMYDEEFFEKNSLLIYYYEGNDTYITDAFSLAKKTGGNIIRVRQTSLEGPLKGTYKSSNALIVFLDIDKVPDDSKIELSVKK